MFVLKNAWKTVTRNKGRNILIVIIVAIIAAAATIGLSIRNAADNARETGLASTTVTATISADRSKLMEQARESSSSSSSSSDSSSSSSDSAPDFSAMRAAMESATLSLADYQKYEKASSVPVSSYYSESTGVSGTDSFQPVESTSSNSANSSSSSSSDSSSSSGDSNSSGQPGQGGPGGDGQGGGDRGGMMMTSGDFTLTGFSSDTAVAKAQNGTFTMTSGEVFGYGSDDNGKVIISKALADFNDLEVGDTITVTNPSDTSKTYTLTICGIYENTTSSNTNAMGPMGGTSQDADNAIYTSVSTLKSLGLDSTTTANDDDDNTTTQLTYTYVFDNADDYETFASDVKKAGLADTYTVQSADVENYESSLVPLDNLAKFALTLLIVVLAVGAVVLIVLNLFNIRERKYEVGVLTAIGVKKAKVAAQFAIELLIVTMCGIALGVAGGAAASVPVSNQLLAAQVSSQETQAASQQEQFGRGADMGGAPGANSGSSDSSGSSSDSSSSDSSSSNSSTSNSSTSGNSAPSAPGGDQGGMRGGFNRAVDYVSTINATVNLKVVGQLILIGLGLTLVSALVGIIFVMRYEPLQILADRS
ncbi:FtsX-like permease family protein [Bifidobacterium leontopitheci]|uniref:ABC transporter permease n=1 Tax=Bifidobacterium leontopitheci TaxID=2650774 RepID=A0A6I1GE10_9BIFI|nr:ABC transporter permease [Bifidobacterium leontopitheci]KAB7789874.1 ABC transporter permease [Bifidobacterium leontopitheci]